MNSRVQDHIATLADRRRALLDEIWDRPRGFEWCSRHAQIADEAVQALYQDLLERTPGLPPLAILATGGYGRREMAPYSDIDLTVLPLEEASPVMDQAIRSLFQDLHEAFRTHLKLEVGYAYRLIADVPGLDATTRTGLLDVRLVAGSHELLHALQSELARTMPSGEFLLAKLGERSEQYAKHHDTPLVAEPQLKEGAGGLRDVHAANWMREAIGEHRIPADEAYETVLRVRNLLHAIVGRRQDLLNRTRQAEIAARLETDARDWMPEVVEAGVAMHRHYTDALERIRDARFDLASGVMAMRGEARPYGDVDGGATAVGLAMATRLGLRVPELPIPPPRTIDGPSALYALSQGEPTIRNLDRCGLLGYLLPELTSVRTLLPDDNVHTYTVFEHTMRVVRNLDRISPTGFLGEVRSLVNDAGPLYLAALMHDVGKRAADHSVAGALATLAVAKRWGLATTVGEMAAWLVREHLQMSRFIRLRDIQNPATVAEFAQIVGDRERLNLLTLLTWADVDAVSAGAWTPAQETFLRQLYERTSEQLGDAAALPDPALYRARLLRQLRGQEPTGSVQQFVESLPAYYVLSTPPDVVRLHMSLVQKATQGEPSIEIFHRSDVGATDFTVCTRDRPGLLSQLLGVFYAFDISVSGIRASTTSGNPAVALDVFTVNFGGRPVPAATCKQTAQAILEVLEGQRTVEDVLHSKGKDPGRKQSVFRYHYVAGTQGILEIRAPRGRGMPFRFCRHLAAQGWNILSARVGQWGGNGAATFYILGQDGAAPPPEDVDLAMAD